MPSSWRVPRKSFCRHCTTPGHARGHLCFYDAGRGALLSGDNIVGLGSVLIDPPEGKHVRISDFTRNDCARCKMFRDFRWTWTGEPNLTRRSLIHCHRWNESELLEAVCAGNATPQEIVAQVYTDVSPKAHGMAERAVLAHLEKLEADGKVVKDKDVWLQTIGS